MGMFGSLRYLAMMSSNLNGGGTGTGGAPSDWNAKEGEAGHILNRPFYDESSVVEILSSTTIPISETEGMITDPIPTIYGSFSEVTITWNGVDYTCTPTGYSADGMAATVLGNVKMIETGGEESSGEPFIIMVDLPTDMIDSLGAYSIIMALDGSESVTIKMKAVSGYIKTLDPKFFGFDWKPVRGYKPLMSYTLTEAYITLTEDGANSLFNGVTDVIVKINGNEYVCGVTRGEDADLENSTALMIGDSNMITTGVINPACPFFIMISGDIINLTYPNHVDGEADIFSVYDKHKTGYLPLLPMESINHNVLTSDKMGLRVYELKGTDLEDKIHTWNLFGTDGTGEW